MREPREVLVITQNEVINFKQDYPWLDHLVVLAKGADSEPGYMFLELYETEEQL